MIYTKSDFPNGVDAEQLRLDLVAGTDGIFTLNTDTMNFEIIFSAATTSDIIDKIDKICRAHFAKDWSKVTNTAIKQQIAQLESGQSRAIREAALGMDSSKLKTLDANIAVLRAQLK